MLQANHQDKKYIEKRVNAVSEHLPRLTYLLSDVLVFVDRNDLAAFGSYYRSVKKVLTRSVEGIRDAQRPCCILVQNFSEVSDPMDPDTITKCFFKNARENQDGKTGLETLYLDIRCIKIPHFTHNSQEFQKQIRLLWVILILGCNLTAT